MAEKVYIKLWLSYRDYFAAYSAAEVGRLVLAMMDYRETGAEPEFSGSERFIWPVIRRDIDAQKEALDEATANGKKGGRPRKGSKPEETQEKGDEPPETGNNQGHGQGHGHGQGQYHGQEHGDNPHAPLLGDVAAVLSDYLNRINASASQTSLDELRGFVEAVGPDVCRRAFDIALDSKKATWPYIRAILQDKAKRGVKCLADWDALDQKPKQAGKVPYGSAGEAPLGDLERDALARMLGGAGGG